MCFLGAGHAAATKLSDIILESASVDDVEMSRKQTEKGERRLTFGFEGLDFAQKSNLSVYILNTTRCRVVCRYNLVKYLDKTCLVAF